MGVAKASPQLYQRSYFDHKYYKSLSNYYYYYYQYGIHSLVNPQSKPLLSLKANHHANSMQLVAIISSLIQMHLDQTFLPPTEIDVLTILLLPRLSPPRTIPLVRQFFVPFLPNFTDILLCSFRIISSTLVLFLQRQHLQLSFPTPNPSSLSIDEIFYPPLSPRGSNGPALDSRRAAQGLLH